MNVFKYDRTKSWLVAQANKIKETKVQNLTVISTDEIISTYDQKEPFVFIASNTQQFYGYYATKKVYELFKISYPIIKEPNPVYSIPEILSPVEIPDILIDAVKPTVNLFINFYITPVDKRNVEILTSLYKNVENDVIDKIYVMRKKSDCHNIKSDKIIDIITEERPKYSSIFSCINKYTTDEDINIILNSDCFLNSNFKYIPYNMKYNDCYLLTRLEIIDPNDLSNLYRMVGTTDSQDGWVFKGKVHVKGGNYLLGKLGCDNKICYEINRSRYNIINPFKSNIFLYHYHVDSYRSYDTNNETDRLPRPYAYAYESTINIKSDIEFSFTERKFVC